MKLFPLWKPRRERRGRDDAGGSEASPGGNALSRAPRNGLNARRFTCRAAPTALALCAAIASPALAQELFGALGATRLSTPRDTSHAILASYSHDLGEHLSGSLTYTNEGHFPGHHRDGHSAQLWLRTGAWSPQLAFAVGAGPYRFFDTTVAENTPGFLNAHGWGVQLGATATWRAAGSPWLYQLRVSRIEVRHGNPDSTQVLAAVGYRLEPDGSSSRNASPHALAGAEELTLYRGRTIVNSLESESTHAGSKGLEYRHAFGPVLRACLAWVDEGDARLTRRSGAVAQAFLEPSFHDGRFTLGLGFGAYVAADDRAADTSTRVMPLVTTTVSYRIARAWAARLTWHRIVSNYDRDSDIVLLGVGYRF